MTLQASYLTVKVLKAIARSWTLTTYVLFVLSFGYSLGHVNMLNVVFMTTIFWVDPLTGALGDKYGYKRIYTVGALLWGAGELVYGLGGNFMMFVLAEFIAALGYAAESEALESLIDNELPPIISTDLRAKSKSLAHIFGIGSAVLGGFVGSYFGLQWPWVIAGICNFGLAIITWKIIPNTTTQSKEQSDEESFVTKLQEGAKLTWNIRKLRWMVVLTAVSVACFQPFNMFWSAHLESLTGQSWWLGFIWMGIAIMLSYGAYLTKDVVYERIALKHFGYLSLAIAAAIIMAALNTNVLLVALTFVLHELPRGAWDNIAATYVNRDIPANKKSTVNSFRSAMGTGGAACGLIISGGLASFLSIPQIWLLSAACLIVLTMWVFWGKVK